MHRRLREEGYRGPDRRLQPESDELRSDPSWRWAGALLVAISAGSLWISLDERLGGSTDTALSGIWSAALVLALLVALTSHHYWRATGEAAGAFLGTAGWLLVAILAIDLVSDHGPSLGFEAIARSGLSLAAAFWVARAATGPEVDTTMRPLPQLAGAVLVAGAVVAAGALLSLVAPSATTVGIVAHAAAAVGWGVAAGMVLSRAMRGSTILLGWVVWLAVAMTAAEIARAFAVTDSVAWLFAGASFRSAGSLLGLIGAIYGLSRGMTVRRDRLLGAAAHERQSQEALLVERELDVHELRNALLSVEGAAATLRDHRAQLSRDDQEQLDDAVVAGITHLRELLGPAGQRREIVPLLTVAQQQAALARLRGMDVEVVGDEEAYAASDRRTVIQVLGNLLSNAERHAAVDGPARVRIDFPASVDRAMVRVRDHGPGIPASQRQIIFVSGVRLDPTRPGDGVGLPLAAQLVRQQGGELWVEDAPGGGACFVMALPRADSAAGGGVLDEQDHLTEVAQRPPRDGPVASDPASALHR